MNCGKNIKQPNIHVFGIAKGEGGIINPGDTKRIIRECYVQFD